MGKDKRKSSKKKSKRKRADSDSATESEGEWVELGTARAEGKPSQQREDWMLGQESLFGDLGHTKRKRNPEELADSELTPKELEERRKKVGIFVGIAFCTRDSFGFGQSNCEWIESSTQTIKACCLKTYPQQTLWRS
jgi:hypothetical protein